MQTNSGWGAIGAGLTSGRLLAKNTIWNLLGQVLPMAVAIIVVPRLIHRMGASPFGVLSLAWVIIGYFSFFDLGIGRAVTKLVSDKLALAEIEDIPSLVWTSMFLMFAFGMIGGSLLVALSPWMCHKALNIPLNFQADAMKCFWILAISIPITTLSSGIRGVLEAAQKFRLLTTLRIPLSSFSYLGSILVLPFSNSLFAVTAMLLIGRIIGLALHFWYCMKVMPFLLEGVVIRRSLFTPLLRFGGWLTVSNVISPIMLYADRFLISGLVSVSAVGYYSAPFDVITRVWIIPGSIVGVLFPAFSVSVNEGIEKTQLLLDRGMKYVAIIVFPIVLVAVAFAPEALNLWLGSSFAASSIPVLRLIAAGVLINSVAQVPFTLIQGSGFPNWTAVLHAVELPIYLISVWMLTIHFGIAGTALAWLGRNVLDTIVILFMTRKLGFARLSSLRAFGAAAVAASVLLYGCTSIQGTTLRLFLVALLITLFLFGSWRYAFTISERSAFLRLAFAREGPA
ncbi:MAG TPA: flippase [Terracidiphilus sp.]|jgi:O-antigen/teichoic acid export membrane protein